MSHNENAAGACINHDEIARRPDLAELESLLKANTAERPQVRIALPANAADDLRCLFFHGPTWDGNVPSKAGRDELVRLGLVSRGNGWQWLTHAGVQACFDNGIHLEKEARESREQRRRNIAFELANAVLGRDGMITGSGSAGGAGSTAREG